MRFKPTFTLILISLVTLSLGACRAIMDPTFMPAGYRYHQEDYKAPPGPRTTPEPTEDANEEGTRYNP